MPLTAKRSCLAIVLLPCLLAALSAHSQNPSAALGKRRAATSPLQWEVREAGHPNLGNIRFAVLKTPVETAVGNSKVYSRAYLSCQKGAKKFAVELTNTSALGDSGGLQPAVMPRLMCNRPENDKLVREELLTNWEVSPIGDLLVRGFRAFPLRECVSIDVLQEVVLPAGWAKKTTQVAFEINPYDRELDSIFATCGEISAYAPGEMPPAIVASTPVSAPQPPRTAAVSVPPKPPAPSPPAARLAPSPPAPAPSPPQVTAPSPAAVAPWQQARTTANGKTNVRADASLQSAIMASLHPGSVVLVQKTGSEWWRVKMTGTTAQQGYIRQDRLVFK